jgi:hypothetical protein
MADDSRVGEMEVGQDLEFQRRSWWWQRVGWALMVLTLVAALLGLFGSGGLLAAAEAGGRGSALWVEYNRFGRLDAEDTTLRVHLEQGAASGGGLVRLWLSREYLEGVVIRTITPEPESVEAGPDRFTYVFRASDPSRPVVLTFHLEPDRMGRLPGQIGLEGGQTISFSQFIYP